MSDTNEEFFRLYFLQEYHQYGMPARVELVKFFLKQLREQLKTYNPKLSVSEEKFALNNKQKLSLLQIGTISHLMMLIEDVAIIFTAFKNNDWDYYKYLDGKGEEDLGSIIGKFYSNVDALKDDDIRFMLGYLDPKNLENSTESEKDFLRFIIQKDIKSMRYFLGKSSVFWSSHIAVFRRYKHAGFPMIMGIPVPKNDDMLRTKFDFMTLVSTAKKDFVDEVTVIPFSNKAINSYQVFLEDLFLILYCVLESNLIKLGRKLDGTIPNPNELFGKRLTKKQRKRLGLIYSDFLKSTMPKEPVLHVRANSKGLYHAWYVDLDTYEKSSMDLAIEEESNKSKQV